MAHIECPNCRKLLPEAIEIIPAGEAQLCGNCNCLTRAPNGCCEGCGSQSIVNLERLLQRPIVNELKLRELADLVPSSKGIPTTRAKGEK
jgi:hypothetical protein